ncbi:MAG: DUF4345 family protein, partial [Gammaproteobacteria bacterium]
ARFLSLSSLVVTGGIGRLISLLVVGIPSPLMIFALVMELGVTPAMAFWQHQISKRSP